MKKLILLGMLVGTSVFVGPVSAAPASRIAEEAISELESRFDLSAAEAEELYNEVESLIEELKSVRANKVEIEQAVSILVSEFKRELKEGGCELKKPGKHKKQAGHGKLYNLVKYTIITLVTLYILKRLCANFAPDLNAKINAKIATLSKYLSEIWNREGGVAHISIDWHILGCSGQTQGVLSSKLSGVNWAANLFGHMFNATYAPKPAN